jgi:hypothetical protein
LPELGKRNSGSGLRHTKFWSGSGVEKTAGAPAELRLRQLRRTALFEAWHRQFELLNYTCPNNIEYLTCTGETLGDVGLSTLSSEGLGLIFGDFVGAGTSGDCVPGTARLVIGGKGGD